MRKEVLVKYLVCDRCKIEIKESQLETNGVRTTLFVAEDTFNGKWVGYDTSKQIEIELCDTCVRSFDDWMHGYKSIKG